MPYPLVILGGGLSGLAAGIRFARFGQKVLILEKHAIAGGLNSYYFRQGHLLETGLHAMTNYALPSKKSAPLNRLFRQLKLKRKKFTTFQQFGSEVIFPGKNFTFTNDFAYLIEQIKENFPDQAIGFNNLVSEIDSINPFLAHARTSARQHIKKFITDHQLIDMLLCPLMFYGNSEEDDMDYSQFIIMFRSIYQEGFFRPKGTIKDLLDMLVTHYRNLGGEIRYKSEVNALEQDNGIIQTVRLTTGERIKCDRVISTIGAPATLNLNSGSLPAEKQQYTGRLSFVESIYLVPKSAITHIRRDRTIIFFNNEEKYRYCRPDEPVNINSGVICFPENFVDLDQGPEIQIRVTHMANYHHWKHADRKNSAHKGRTQAYLTMKREWQQKSLQVISKIIGDFQDQIIFQDSFTPLTIEKYSNKEEGAVYGSPIKIKSGQTNYDNLFLAGTDQGFLGIVGSMLSGITVVNQHCL